MVNGTSIRVAILNPQEDYARRLKGHLLAIDGVKIIGEVSDRSAYANAVRQWRPDVIVLDLDPEPHASNSLTSKRQCGSPLAVQSVSTILNS